MKHTTLTLTLPLIAASSIFFAACTGSQEQPEPEVQPESTTQAEETTQESPDTSKTAEGTINYTNPGGNDEIRFTIKIEDEVISEVSAEVLAEHEVSIAHQEAFAKALGEAVVGKKLSEVEVDRIGGSSLTTGAFNEFLSGLR